MGVFLDDQQISPKRSTRGLLCSLVLILISGMIVAATVRRNLAADAAARVRHESPSSAEVEGLKAGLQAAEAGRRFESAVRLLRLGEPEGGRASSQPCGRW